jgi:F-type H+-transporting ATPase subunit b
MDLLSAEPGLIFWTIVTFLLLLAILWKFAWNPILGALDARERAIQKTIEDAERLQAEAQAILEEHQKRLADWESKRQRVQASLEALGD